MAASETFNVRLRVLRKGNKNKNNTFSVPNVPLMSSVTDLKEYFLNNCKDELAPAINTSFQIGYFGERNQKFTIQSSVQLAEAYSLAKAGWLTLWIDPHSCLAEKSSTRQKSTKGPKESSHSSLSDDDEDDFSKNFARLQKIHDDLPDFKLRCWAKMLVNGTHKSLEEPPNVPFFTGKPAKKSRDLPSTNTAATATNPYEDKIKLRGAIIQQLKDLGSLKDNHILTEREFNEQKEKLISELTSL